MVVSVPELVKEILNDKAFLWEENEGFAKKLLGDELPTTVGGEKWLKQRKWIFKTISSGGPNSKESENL